MRHTEDELCETNENPDMSENQCNTRAGRAMRPLKRAVAKRMLPAGPVVVVARSGREHEVRVLLAGAMATAVRDTLVQVRPVFILRPCEDEIRAR